VLDSGADSGERQRGEMGSWVGEMAGDVGDSIWSSVKEEAHQRAVSTRARLCWRGMAVEGGVQWWGSLAHGSERLSGHGRSLAQHRRSVSVAGGG
jgi:hypothetical protein